MRIAQIADIHVGHKAAIWPLVYENEEGDRIEAYKWQKILLDYWEDFWNQPEVKDSEIILNLAESIEGKGEKEFGKNLRTPDIDLQADAFYELIKPKIGKRKYIVVSGNKYHESGDAETERQVAKRLKAAGVDAEFVYVIGNRRWDKKIVSFMHMGTEAMLYKSTALDRKSLFRDAEEGNFPHSKFNYHTDLIAMGHSHKYFINGNESRVSYISPCWKFWHPIRQFGAKAYERTQPSIGGCVIEISKSIAPKPFFYPIKHIYDALK